MREIEMLQTPDVQSSQETQEARRKEDLPVGEAMKKTTMLLLVTFGTIVTVAAASSKISGESYRLLRQLVSYKNREINDLHALNDYMLDCRNVSDEQFTAKKCSDRLTSMQSEDRDLQVKHDVLGQEIATHIRQH